MSLRDFFKRTFPSSKKQETGAQRQKTFHHHFAPDYKIYYSAYGTSSPNQLSVEILSGPLQNTRFELEQEITDCKMSLFLKTQGEPVGRSLIDRNPRSGEIIYWDVMVDPKYRMKGLASFMTKYMLRELLLLQKKIKFMIRMIRIFQPTDTTIKLQNLGICVIAHRLGLTCEFDLQKLLNPLNIIKVEVIPPETDTLQPKPYYKENQGYDQGSMSPPQKNDLQSYSSKVILPPCYKIDLHSYPYVLIGFIIDPKTKKPIINYETYLQIKHKPEVLEEWIRTKAIVIGNGNYLLKKDGFEDFVKCLAQDDYEAEVFRKKLQSY